MQKTIKLLAYALERDIRECTEEFRIIREGGKHMRNRVNSELQNLAVVFGASLVRHAIHVICMDVRPQNTDQLHACIETYMKTEKGLKKAEVMSRYASKKFQLAVPFI